MKEKKDCKIVQDLLPNYLEHLTVEETNTYINEHISTCEECKDMLSNMEKEIKICGEKREERPVKFFKKYNRKIKALSGIILAIIIIYGIIVIRNVAILTGLLSKTGQVWNPDNLHTVIYNHSGGQLNVIESYYLNGRSITYYTTYEDLEIRKSIFYSDEEKNETYIEHNGNKIAFVNDNATKVMISPHLAYSTPFEIKFIAAFSNITSTECNGEECYFINTLGFKGYFNKATGLSVRAMQTIRTGEDGTFNEVVDYKYEFGTVKEEDFVLPDISEYKIIEE